MQAYFCTNKENLEITFTLFHVIFLSSFVCNFNENCESVAITSIRSTSILLFSYHHHHLLLILIILFFIFIVKRCKKQRRMKILLISTCSRLMHFSYTQFMLYIFLIPPPPRTRLCLLGSLSICRTQSRLEYIFSIASFRRKCDIVHESSN